MAKKTEDNQAEPTFSGPPEDQTILRYTWACRQEAYTAKRDRMLLNKRNFDAYNLKGDFSHKKRGQSQEFLPRQMMATEQISSFVHQALIDIGDWFRVDAEPGNKDPIITPNEMRLLMKRQLEKIDFHATIEDSMKMGLLGSLVIMKIHGEWVEKPRFYVRAGTDPSGAKKEIWKKKKKVWQLKTSLVRQEDWYPDPTGDKLFDIQNIETDLFRVKADSKGPNAIYDPEIVDEIVGGFEDVEQVGKKARETAQNQTFQNLRKRVRLWECYGNILDPTTGELLHENVTWTVCNDRFLIRKPTPYPFWHGKRPFVVVPIIRQGQPQAVWHKALMDASTYLNNALNELFNLQLDTGMMSAHGIKQLHTGWMADESQMSDGFAPGDTIEVNEQCPPGAKVLEAVQTSEMSPEVMNTYQQLSSEFQQASLTNDLRMGVMPSRQVKATEVVEASQTITSMFTGITKVIEESLLVGALQLIWPTMAQHLNDLDDDEVTALIGRTRALELNAVSNEELFTKTARGYQFKAYGISETLKKQGDFRKLMSLIQTISSDPPLMEEFVKKYDMGMLLTQVMRALDINVEDLEIPKEEQEAMAKNQMGAPGGMQPGTTPNMQSNLPQAGAGPLNPGFGGPQPAAAQGGIPQAHFPPSRALQVERR